MQSDDLNMRTEWSLIVETGSPAVLGYSPVRPETLRRHLSMVLPMWQKVSDAGVETLDEENPDVPWISLSFRVSGNAEFVEAMRSDLKLMTEERPALTLCFALPLF